jgi:hypothetical protein
MHTFYNFGLEPRHDQKTRGRLSLLLEGAETVCCGPSALLQLVFEVLDLLH